MFEFFIVSFGSILGANTRFKLKKKLEKFKFRNAYLTLSINTIASFALGLFLSIIDRFSHLTYSYQYVLFFSIGFLGSLSTFSSFVYDLFDLSVQFKFSRALNLAIISILFGIISFAFGSQLFNQ